MMQIPLGRKNQSFAEENDVNVNYEFISATDFVTKLNAAIEAEAISGHYYWSSNESGKLLSSNPYMDVSDLVDEINAERPYMESIYEGSKSKAKTILSL